LLICEFLIPFHNMVVFVHATFFSFYSHVSIG